MVLRDGPFLSCGTGDLHETHEHLVSIDHKECITWAFMTLMIVFYCDLSLRVTDMMGSVAADAKQCNNQVMNERR